MPKPAMQSHQDLKEMLAGDVLSAALSLLGCFLIRGKMRAKLVEVEAYRGFSDPGCHAFRGMTPRTRVMFGPPGHAYVYFTYGNHWMLNVVAEEEGIGSAVLFRAAEPLSSIEEMKSRRPKAARARDLLSGPGKLAAAFGIDKKDYGLNLLKPRSELRIEPGVPPKEVLVGPRIGLTKGMGDEFPWRFVDARALEWVSRPLRGLRAFRLIEELRR